MLADMTQNGDLGLRIAQEVRALSDLGYRAGLLHVRSSGPCQKISPDLRGCVRRGEAELVDTRSKVQAALVVAHGPETAWNARQALAEIVADRLVLVVSDPADVDWVELAPIQWPGLATVAPASRSIRTVVEQRGGRVQIEPQNWPSACLPVEPAAPPWRAGRSPAIGWIGPANEARWSKSADVFAKTLPTDGSFEILVLGRPPARVLPAPSTLPRWGVFDYGDIGIERFISRTDVLIWLTEDGKAHEPPVAAIGAALASGKIVVLPPRLRPRFGPGAVYCAAHDAFEVIRGLFDDATALEHTRAAAVRYARQQFPNAALRQRMERLVTGEVNRKRHPKPAKRSDGVPRVLFIPSNGVGLGHVARSLAIARHSNDRFCPVFATLAQAVDAIEAFGFLTEYIPSQSYVHADFATWDAWFEVELARLIDRFDARAVVFDGSNAPPGLIRAAGSRNTRLAWIRRGMWGRAYTPLIENARFFDLIIEPGEIAADRDHGVTALRRHEATVVEPIRLLDAGELLSREEAMRAIGLDPARPAALVQLGAGSDQDLLSVIAAAVRELQNVPDVQVAVAEWPMSPVRLALWPDVTTIRGFPLSQYFNAFDFSVAAAGYNTFHDVIAFELPTIFVPNKSLGRDDQLARAEFAQDAGAAFELAASRLFELPQICTVLLNADARQVLKQNCRRIAQRNGAMTAAGALAKLVKLS